MMHEFYDANLMSVERLFEGKVFRVPDYQRNYSWEARQWEDFWNDIKDGLETHTEHYWGTIILRKIKGEFFYFKEEEKRYEVYEVVDGQQRLTTLYLFFLALSRVGRKEIFFKRYVKSGDIYRLELGGLNKEFIKSLVDGNPMEPDIKSNRLLKECLEYFEDQIRAYGKIDELSGYVPNLTFSLEFVLLDEILAVKAFETLNDRGKPLNLLDKTKSFLMFFSVRYAPDTRPEINRIFGNVFTAYDLIKDTGEKEGIDYIKSNRFTEDELLRFFYHYFAHYAIQKYNLPDPYYYDTSAADVFEIFIKGACNHLKQDPGKLKNFVHEFLTELDRFVHAFQKLMEEVKSNSTIRRLFCFSGLDARVYPLIIALKATGDEALLDDEMLHLIDVLDMRIYKIKGTDPRADLYRNVIATIKMNPDRDKIKEGIREFINRFMSDESFSYHLKGHLYQNKATKYILWEYEKYKNPEFNDLDYELYTKCQKEHILPQAPGMKFPAYGFKDEEDYFSTIHTLGNLCLLEEDLNVKCQNKGLQEKARYYQTSRIKTTRTLGFEIENRGFTRENIEKRTDEIARFCLMHWKL